VPGSQKLTMLFTDVEGSTRLARLLGDDWPEVLRTHRRLMREAILAADGHVVDTEGDAFFAMFPDPLSGVCAAIAGQRAMRAYELPNGGGELRVRMGLHTGEARHVDGEYIGLAVHRAARIADAAHGGQVLVSTEVEAALDEIGCVDLGEHRLKDFPEPERLFHLCVDEDRPATDFPPPCTLGAHASVVLLERDEDLAALARFVDVLVEDGAGGLVRIDGPAGAGKTSLMTAAVDLARARGARVLLAQASEFERDVPLGVVRQLLEPPLVAANSDERARLTGGPGRLGAEALDLEQPVDRPPPAPTAALHGFSWVCTNLAHDQPLLIAIDDAQWADLPSQRFAAYLARRLEGQAIGLMLSVRAGVAGDHEQLLSGVPAMQLEPQPLTPAAVEALARRRIGGRTSAALVADLHRATAGNPFLVEELLRSPESLSSGASAQGLATDSILRRVGTAGGPRLAVTRAVAILDDDAELRRVAALADTGEETAPLVDALVEAELLAPGWPLRFTHPIIRGVVYDNIGGAGRAQLHRRAATLLDDDGVDADRTAVHLLHADPAGDPAAAACLFRAAITARRRGATQTAIDLLKRALREPPPTPEQADVLVELGRAELDAGQHDGIAHLLSALPGVRDPGRRADVVIAAATGIGRRAENPRAVALLDEAIDETDDRELVLELEAHRAMLGRADLRTAQEASARLHALASTLAGATPAERRVLSVAAMANPPDEPLTAPRVADLCRRALRQREELRDEHASMEVELLPITLMIAGCLDEAHALLDEKIATARRRGSAVAFAMASSLRSNCHYYEGSLADAEADARVALESSGLARWGLAPTVAALVVVLLERGAWEESQDWISRCGYNDTLPDGVSVAPLLYARGRLRIACGRRADGLADLLALGARQAAVGTPHADPPWRAAVAVALLAENRSAEAQQMAADHLTVALRWNTSRDIGVALRTAALVADDDTTIATLEESVSVLAGSRARLEHAYSLVELGAALRRANRRADARGPLREGLAMADRCGAIVLEERAREELRATGARPRRSVLTGVDSLTASERRVAQLASEGRTNREIAQDLFVTVNTIESHMRHVFQKLAITSRTELAALELAGTRSDYRKTN
jgi:class 3 adenylate cyclase/DNA-binding CsgD family transcriptional regulator/tetratricopeptide (TPR) repeat protein